MTQPLTDDLTPKAAAIASVLWLMEAHYAMIKAGRVGSCIHYERKPDGTERWRPPIVEEVEGWPVNKVIAWVMAQRKVSGRYRLWAIGLALQKLERVRPELALAVKVAHMEIPTPNWYEPALLRNRAREGLEWMAEDIPGDVPEWGGEKAEPVENQIRRLKSDGLSERQIVTELRRHGVHVGRDRIRRALSNDTKCESVPCGSAVSG